MKKSPFGEVKLENKITLYHHGALSALKSIKSNSIDSVVCDPPYGVNIMKRDWDKSLPDNQIWRECFRVLKPGGHILAFSSARFYHHLAVAIENSGFDTFNMLAWIYSSGFPKGKNLSLEFDRSDGLPKPDDEFREYLRSAIKKSPYKIVELEKICGTKGMFCHYLGKSQPCFPSEKVWKILKTKLNLDSRYDKLFKLLKFKREELSKQKKVVPKSRHLGSMSKVFDYHVSKSEPAKKWEGWRYGKQSLKPCLEPIYFGQKPPIRPVTENVVTWNTGALNIEGCSFNSIDGKTRLPGNLMSDGTLDSPYFYVAKPSKKERAGNVHPTVKPLELMRSLVRLVTPKGGVVLDPFMGSGTTGVAAKTEGIGFVGIERELEYFEISRRRLEESLRHAA